MAQSTDPHLAGDGSRRRSRKVCSISVIAVDDVYPYIGRQGEHAMASQVVQFAGLSDRDRKKGSPLSTMTKGDHLELRVRRPDGDEETFSLPPAAASLVETLLTRLFSGERVARLAVRHVDQDGASGDLGRFRELAA